MRRIIIITGPVNSGKTSYLHRLTTNYKREGYIVGGITAEALYEKGRKIGYDVCDLISKQCCPLVRSSETADHMKAAAGVQHVGRFVLLESGLDFTRRCIQAAAGVDIVCLDEVGPLEMDGRGHRQVLDTLLADFKGTLLVVARDIVSDALMIMAEKQGWIAEKQFPSSS
ncbi:MAG: nucleoside-triphosphatase [Spirochaetia bacterium]|nr:nucleoside-triphosphatase [Spirochaetia bacterium]